MVPGSDWEILDVSNRCRSLPPLSGDSLVTRALAGTVRPPKPRIMREAPEQGFSLRWSGDADAFARGRELQT